MTAVRVAIAGCGMIAGAPLRGGRPIATNHAEAVAQTPGAVLVAAADPDEGRRRAFTEHWRVPQAFESVKDMLASGPIDLLIVATPPASHAEVCELAVARGVRGILCEKPFTGVASQARRVVALCRSAGVVLAVNFTRRWDPSHAQLTERVRRGELGEIRWVTGTYTGTLRGNGSHLIDTTRMLVGDDWRLRWASPCELVNDDGPIGATLHREGATWSFAPVVGAEYFVFELALVGTKGRARLILGGNDVRIDWPAPSPDYPGYKYLLEEERLPRDTLPAAFANAVGAVARAISAGAPLPYDAGEHVRTLEIIDEMAHAARTNKETS